MNSLCGVCGGQLDDQALMLTIEIAPGRHGNQHRTVPFRLTGWPVCQACLTGPGGAVLAAAVQDEYMEPVILRPPTSCTTVCVGGRAARLSSWRRFWSIRQGTIGVPPAGKCPVCQGPVEAEIAAGEAS